MSTLGDAKGGPCLYLTPTLRLSSPSWDKTSRARDTFHRPNSIYCVVMPPSCHHCCVHRGPSLYRCLRLLLLGLLRFVPRQKALRAVYVRIDDTINGSRPPLGQSPSINHAGRPRNATVEKEYQATASKPEGGNLREG